tara:strand:- start:10 stop:219 length:210 start_codon:yes stop_codon:yes gene_type:complete
MAKKRRSAKQKANDKRLGRMAKARSKTRKTTTRKRRTTRRGDKTLSGKPAYKRKSTRRKTNKESMWSNW